MMKKIALLIVTLLCGCIWAQAQGTFSVLVTNGSVTHKTGGKRIWAGTTLSPQDAFVVGSSSYIGMRYSNGKTLEIKQPGTYKVADLSKKMGEGTSSAGVKYVNYVVGEMAKADKEDINKNHRKYSAITGSVQRAIDGAAVVFFPLMNKANQKTPNIYVFDPKVVLKLYPNPAQNTKRFDTYEVSILDYGNKELQKIEVPIKSEDQIESVEVDFSKLPIKYEPAWIIRVGFKGASANEGKSEFSVTWDQETPTYQEVKAELEKQTLDQEPTALDNIIQAAIFEQNEYYLDALKCYDEAVKLQPEVDTYKIAFNDFIARNKMKLVLSKDGKPTPIDFDNQAKSKDFLKENAQK